MINNNLYYSNSRIFNFTEQNLARVIMKNYDTGLLYENELKNKLKRYELFISDVLNFRESNLNYYMPNVSDESQNGYVDFSKKGNRYVTTIYIPEKYLDDVYNPEPYRILFHELGHVYEFEKARNKIKYLSETDKLKEETFAEAFAEDLMELLLWIDNFELEVPETFHGVDIDTFNNSLVVEKKKLKFEIIKAFYSYAVRSNFV